MTFATDFNIDLKASLKERIKTVALGLGANSDYEASAEIFCDKLNRMNAMSDAELAQMDLPRNQIGAHVLETLRPFDA